MIDRSTGERRAAIERLRDDPAGTRLRLSTAWADAWDALVAPYWTQIERMLHADIAVRARRIAVGGLGAAVGGLHRRVSWRGDAVRVELRAFTKVLDCRGSGLVLAPSVLGSAGPFVLTNPPVEPTVFYPAQGVGADWHRRTVDAERAIAALVGPARAGILLTAHQARTTGEVAADLGLAISTASHHLAVLREAGLVDSRRDGRAVRHVRTPLGEAVVGGAG
nr:helix-turn-helix domain-containing protein [Agromyces seonyuensis]